MTDNFITIDDQAISLKQAIGYLNTTGDLPKFIQRILYRHIIEQTLSHRLDVAVEPQQIEQAIVNFRVQNKLTEPAPFEEWLKSQGLTYESFQKRVSESLRVEVLKQKEISQESRKYFNDNKAALDRIVLSRIVVLAQALAKEIQQQLTNGTATFEALAKQHSVTNDSSLGGLMGTLQMGQLPQKFAVNWLDMVLGILLVPWKWKDAIRFCGSSRFYPLPMKETFVNNLKSDFLRNGCKISLKTMTSN